jgi:hypothetical protein
MISGVSLLTANVVSRAKAANLDISIPRFEAAEYGRVSGVPETPFYRDAR